MIFFDDYDSRYGEDYFESTRMSFGDHIEDLRRHLLRAIAGFCVALVIAFPLAGFVMNFIKAPIEAKLREFYQARLERKLKEVKEEGKYQDKLQPQRRMLRLSRADLARAMGAKLPDDQKDKAEFVEVTVIEQPNPEDLPMIRRLADFASTGLISLSVQEVLMVWLQVAIMTGLVIGSPWIFIQIWAFIAAGLYPHEKRLVNVYLPFAVTLFAVGIVFCYWVVIPRAIDALLFFNDWFDVTPQIRLSEWLSFAIWVPVVFGISFETPLVMMMLDRLGIGSVATYRQFRKYAYFGMAVAAGVLTPTADAVTMLYLLVPMFLLYEAGIWICRFWPGRRLLDFDVPESEEMIEV